MSQKSNDKIKINRGREKAIYVQTGIFQSFTSVLHISSWTDSYHQHGGTKVFNLSTPMDGLAMVHGLKTEQN